MQIKVEENAKTSQANMKVCTKETSQVHEQANTKESRKLYLQVYIQETSQVNINKEKYK